MVTIKDISRLSGFSVTTVSKALNDYPDISQSTRNVILGICEEVGYVPNSSARSLKTQRSYTIGVIFEEETNQGLQHPLFSKILEQFKSEVEKEGYDIMFLAKNMGKQNGSYLQHSMRKQVEAIFVLCADFNAQRIVELSASDIPLVVIDFSVDQALNISSNNDKGVEEAVTHLIDLGHRDIGHIFGDRNTYIGGQRKRRFEETLKKHQLVVRDEWLVAGPNFSKEDGFYAMQQLLKHDAQPTAIFCASDMLAIGAIQAIKEAGKRVPEDYSIVGFDGIDLGQLITPRLTTIRQNTAEMGSIAARNMMELIENKSQKQMFDAINVDTELIIGESSKPIN